MPTGDAVNFIEASSVVATVAPIVAVVGECIRDMVTGHRATFGLASPQTR